MERILELVVTPIILKKTINILMQLRVREIDTGNMAEMLDDGFYQHEKSTD